jgi:hypothetical protein
MKRFRALWQSLWGDTDRRVRLGRFLGLLFIAGGFVTFYFAWDGAASINFAQGQIPYLLSGGFLGLGLVITGATLLFLSTIRSERQLMTDRYDEMARLLGRNLSRMQFSSNGSASTNGQVVAGATTYHRAECKILEGKDGLTTVSVEQAEAEGLERCRVCNPPETKDKDAERESASTN